jgi:exocyst complex component 2
VLLGTRMLRIVRSWKIGLAPQIRKDLTKMPSQFTAFESTVLAGTQKLLYVSEAMTNLGSADVVTPPPAKLLQMVRSQFVTSLYKVLSGMVENAEKSVEAVEDEWINDVNGLANPIAGMVLDGVTANSIDARSRVRSLPTV